MKWNINDAMVRKCNRKQRQHCQSNQSNKCISVVFQFFLLFLSLARSLSLFLHFSHSIVNKRKWESSKCHSISLPHLSNIFIESMNIVLMKSEFIEFRHQLKWPIIHQYSIFHFFVRWCVCVCVCVCHAIVFCIWLGKNPAELEFSFGYFVWNIIILCRYASPWIVMNINQFICISSMDANILFPFDFFLLFSVCVCVILFGRFASSGARSHFLVYDL